MTRYPALIDGETGAYGVTFPDLPGVVAMGATLDEAAHSGESDHLIRRKVITGRSEATRELDYESR